MSHDTKRHEAAATLRAAVLAGLGEFLVVPSDHSENRLFVKLLSEVPAGTRDTHLATVTINADDRRDWTDVVSVSVEPEFAMRRADRAKTVRYWAGWKTDYVIDPAKVLARVRTLVDAKRAHDAAEVERAAWRKDEAAKLAVVTAPVEAFMAEKGIEVGWEGAKRVKDWSATSSGSFSVKLDGLSEADMLAVLAVVAPKGTRA